MSNQQTDSPVPDYKLVVNGRDISSAISNRLVSLTLVDARGVSSDSLTIELHDADGQLEIPPLGAKIELALGWKGSPLIDKGSYTVDELEYSGPPDKLTIYARSADLRATQSHGLSAQKSRSHHNTTLGELVALLASEHGLKASVSQDLKGIRIKHLDQTSESDINLLTRLGDKYDAVVSVKHGTLLFISIGKGVSASGKALPTVTINKSDCTDYRYFNQSRDAYTGVIAYWNNISGARCQKVVIGTTDHAKELKNTYASEPEAKYAAQSELEKLQRKTEGFSVTLSDANLSVEAETPISLAGFKPEKQKWATTSVTHSLSDTALTSTIELEPTSD